MTRFLAIILVIWGGAAQAHPGHIADLAGHDHWVAGAAIGIAILVGVYGALTGKSKEDAEADDDTQEEAEVAA